MPSTPITMGFDRKIQCWMGFVIVKKGNKMTQKEYLKGYAEEMPSWLKAYRKGQPKPLSEFLQSRIVYYPGDRTDWHPLEVFGGSHSAHCFVYADYWLSEGELRSELQDRGIDGYEILDEVSFSESEVMGAIPPNYSRFLSPEELRQTAEGTHNFREYNHPDPYTLLIILERKSGYGDGHGPERLAILYLGADGIATYAAMFAGGNAPRLFGLLLQDHGWGGNYDRFGRGGLLEKIIECSRVSPGFVLAGSDEVYDQYEKVFGLDYSGSRNWELFRHDAVGGFMV